MWVYESGGGDSSSTPVEILPSPVAAPLPRGVAAVYIGRWVPTFWLISHATQNAKMKTLRTRPTPYWGHRCDLSDSEPCRLYKTSLAWQACCVSAAISSDSMFAELTV
jgi:hypothetical protein